MHFMKKYWLAGVALLLLTGSPVSAEETDWTGFYIGFNSGYAFGNSDAHYADPAFRVYSVSSKPDGWSIGVQAGASCQLTSGIFNRVVLGIEGDVSYVDASATIYDYLSDAHGRPDNTIKTSSDCAGTLRARLGYAAGRFLPYLTAGGAGANAKVSATDGSLSQSDFLLGWAVGAGIEYALNKNWSIRAEYLHVDLGRHTWFAGTAWETSSLLTSETFRFGVNYKF
jgi:opacity protein-like surface antigen